MRFNHISKFSFFVRSLNFLQPLFLVGHSFCLIKVILILLPDMFLYPVGVYIDINGY